MRFDIKDINYLVIVIALVISLTVQTIRILELGEEYQWCQDFYNKYGRDM
jgi:hypothetical protein|tara:strand:+ start:456 stop:605 length:150 start_codon:yes stop_codon:yes gene_type:complete